MRRPFLCLRVCALLLASASASVLDAQSPIYVDGRATGANNGTSWADAFIELRDALAATPQGEIWVALGTYRPAPAGGTTAATFALRSGLGIYGGFAGSETVRAQRDPDANVTVLSGDLNGDDLPGWVNRRDNASHVVTASDTDTSARLDGFTVRGGYGIWGFGAGVRYENASATLASCVVTDCYTYVGRGAAIAVAGSSAPALLRCGLTASYADMGRGGALHVGNGCSVTMTDCVVRGNTASTGASLGYAGGVYCEGGGSLVAVRCTFDGNVALFRAAGGSNPPDGGAIVNLGTLTLRECLLVGNRAADGGGLYNLRSATLINCAFDANSATQSYGLGGYGGGIAAVLNAVTVVQGCTFWQNSASEDGGGIYGNDAVSAADSVFWGNRDTNGRIGQSQGKSVTWSHCCIENMLVGVPGEDPPDPAKFPGCIDLDPMLVDPDGSDGVPGNADDDLRLAAASPCIDRGRPASFPAGLDLGGSPRLLDGDLDTGLRVDMGAHEFDHAQLALTVTAPRTLSVAITGTAGMATAFLVGLPASVGIPVGTLGELWLDPLAPLLFVTAGVVPARVDLPLPGGSYTIAFQAVVVGGVAGNFSNPVTLER